MTPKPLMPRGKRSKKPQPFQGLTRKPCCAACEQAIEATRLPPSPPPPPITSTRGRRRQIDTSQHFCPDPACRGFDHGVGHSLLLLYDAKVPNDKNSKDPRRKRRGFRREVSVMF